MEKGARPILQRCVTPAQAPATKALWRLAAIAGWVDTCDLPVNWQGSRWHIGGRRRHTPYSTLVAIAIRQVFFVDQHGGGVGQMELPQDSLFNFGG